MEIFVVDIEDLRRERLQRVVDTKFGGRALACSLAMGRAKSYVSGLLNTKEKKPFGERAARAIEESLGLDYRSLDDDGMAQNVRQDPPEPDSRTSGEPSVDYMTDGRGGQRHVPVLTPWQAKRVIEMVNAYRNGVGYEEFAARRPVGSTGFAMLVQGDSMSPGFNDGDMIVVDPNKEPKPGSFVIATCGEDVVFRKYVARGFDGHGTQIYELLPMNGDYAAFRSDQRACRIIGTVTERSELIP